MRQREIARRQAVAAQLDQQCGNDGKIRHAHGNQQHQRHIDPRQGSRRTRQAHACTALSLAADQVIGSAPRGLILQQPQQHTYAYQHRRERGGFSEIDGRYGGVAVDLRGKHVEADAPAQRGGRSVFRNGFHEHQQRADGIVAAQQRQKYPPQPPPKARAEHRRSLLQACWKVQHGVFQHREHKRKHMQAHHQRQPRQREKIFFAARRRRYQLLEQPALLHKQYPAHGRNVGRRHERDHEQNIKDFVPCEARA